jgi:hypothetical protein
VNTVIVLAADQGSFYEFLKPRQESNGAILVVLDRRRAERRARATARTPERRQRDRRAGTPAAALALMSVLGFMILHRNGDDWIS